MASYSSKSDREEKRDNRRNANILKKREKQHFEGYNKKNGQKILQRGSQM
jgi:hypothetical protein